MEHYQFFTPVAEDVSLEARRCFRGVARLWFAVLVEFDECLDRLGIGVVISNSWIKLIRILVVSAIESLVEWVSCPVDSEIGVRFLVEDYIACGTGIDVIVSTGPKFVTFIERDKVSGKSTSVVARTGLVDQEGASRRLWTSYP